MGNPKPIVLIAASLLLSVGAVAQSTPPAPTGGPGKPAASQPAPPSASAQSLVGKSAFSSDGTRVGDVQAVRTASDGKVTALHVKTGGFLGFGGRIVEVPEGKFTPSNQDVRLSLTAEEASKLPEVKDGT